jgi:chromate transporter
VSDLVDVFVVFIRLTVVAFGGGISILPEMERQVVGTHQWVSHQEFIDAYALSQVTPGPGMLMVVVIGYRAAGLPGALVAGVAMFAPPAALAWFAADRWSRVSQAPVMVLLRGALAPVALGLLAAGAYTLVRIGASSPVQVVLAAAAFVTVATFGRAPWVVVAGGAAIGLVALR